ncbi:large subunit ribosomal protein L25 [Loktanella sp. DSM 29012]|uniref:Large ribosomal subunit protein bL25 n=1 Tax=Loktanella gaetbuli TaxID=2881335 RepID=A0ABS8BVG3_9RHOB|nr:MULTISPECIES: 50S ribosomal protein L25/general stress protein Ctc [Loktanella]MCB5199501.1 50S ribosomal protein L25/general stress protein Ctc [Loktanella gaetbuli]SEQ06313.1 large subunit ribosomal protein L25 [Loktanella sp. DSM 29012]
MADKIPDLHAEVRAGTGKGAARQARRDGQVPGIVYGGGVDPLSINLDFNKLLTRLRKGRFMSTLFNLKVEGHDDVRVICRGIQRHVVKDLPIHIDLMRLKRTSRVNIFIPVTFLNEDTCRGLKAGGVLGVVRNEVEMNVLAGDIPDELTVDLAEAQIGDTIHFSDLTVPDGANPVISDRDFVIATISAPRALAADDDDGDDVDADEVPTTEMGPPADPEE